METPWGTAKYVNEIAPGIIMVGTGSHGGIHLNDERNDQVPNYMRRSSGWYEEDHEWCIPFVVFEEDIIKHGRDGPIDILMANKEHWKALKRIYPMYYIRYKKLDSREEMQ